MTQALTYALSLAFFFRNEMALCALTKKKKK